MQASINGEIRMCLARAVLTVPDDTAMARHHFDAALEPWIGSSRGETASSTRWFASRRRAGSVALAVALRSTLIATEGTGLARVVGTRRATRAAAARALDPSRRHGAAAR